MIKDEDSLNYDNISIQTCSMLSGHFFVIAIFGKIAFKYKK
jgi:hypothetical protein